jgi:membrane fusion protein (multidrug efflux system)
VPSIAVIPELGGKKVFVFEDGAAQPRTVESGIRSESAVEITSGLAEGDLVIITGLLQLQPGLAVEIEEAPATAGSVS